MSKARRTRSRRANVEVTEVTYLPDILRKLEELTKHEVHIGASGDQETAMIAGIHEYGSLKAGIPARSFIGTGKKKAQAAISKLAKSGVNAIVQKSETARGLLESIGQEGESRVVKNFDKIRTPSLSPLYARRKGNGKILVQEQKLRDSITFIVIPKKGRR
ncbi:hypothetical protein BVG16_13735 [Paenibacillus selenitireducens]|uniref:Uncharacterized protein n=1 Tax=Paenibacillus selenitireducens TaxID=1324314 RepID=A0A1T2XC93_9BACL|nr:hypothetical protein [Paenibacillus selenitireducens]OPA77509.1 hypothetical protein BVG16_13735 [Paenibacillus selenitireducens]